MKKKATTFDMLGEAQIPADLLVPTDGSNWGLDGFPDLGTGAGTLHGFFPGDTSTLPGYDTATAASKSDESFFEDEPLQSTSTPDAAWFAASAGETPGLDLTETALMKEGGLADLSWLELVEQDPDRLPQNPVNLGIPELEEAWGVDRRTDGFALHAHALDLNEVRYRQSVENPQNPQFRLTAAEVTAVVQRAMRRSAAGEPLEAILREAAQALGDEAGRAKRAMAVVKAEHGLAGKVFIRAAAYPGYEQGKWDEHFKKCRSARYIVVDRRTLNGSVTVQDGRCTVTRKRAVLEVPWKEALQVYQPALERLGRKVAGASPQEALKAALAPMPKAERAATVFPVHVAPAQRVTAAEAKREFEAMPAPTREVFKTSHEQTNREKAQRRIAGWVKGGMLAMDVAKRIVQSGETGPNMLREAVQHITKTKGASTFSGHLNDARPKVASAKEAREALATVQPPAPINKVGAAVVAYAKRVMSEGKAGRVLSDILRARFSSDARTAAEPGLASVREQHEGGAGFVYVDASAYASPAGTTGCERGATRHRANQLKYVYAMDRCATCVLASVRPDGSRVCREYNKTLVTAADLPDEMATIRRNNIRLADLPDQELTASYFAPAYDPQEFELRNATFDGQLEFDAAPDQKELSDILFGGMEF